MKQSTVHEYINLVNAYMNTSHEYIDLANASLFRHVVLKATPPASG